MPQPLINISKSQAMYFAFFLVMYEFLTYIANDLVMPAMIQVVESFNVSDVYIASSLSLYVIGGASLQLILGPVSDRFGRRPIMMIGAIFFASTTALIACSQTIHQFLVIRFFEGMGLCFISVIGYSVIQEIFSELDAVRLVAILTNISVLAPLLGPLLGAYLCTFISWNYIFLLIALLSVITIWGLWKYMPEPIGKIKSDGVEIKRMELSLKNIYLNYKKLLLDKGFILAAISFGFLSIPCVAWIGISPSMLVTEANLSLISYALWQIPIFGAFILGNIIIIKLTHHFSLKKLSEVGVWMAFSGLILAFILMFLFGESYIWLMPGMVLYFLGFGFSASPLYRLILYTTNVSKGTASALLSMIYMVIQGLGVEGANMVYRTHMNLHYGAFCAIMGIIFTVIMFYNKNLKG